jgi:hypothetical protein
LLNYVATIYFQKGEVKKSIVYLEKLIDLLIELNGPEHLNVGNKYNNLGEAYRQDR